MGRIVGVSAVLFVLAVGFVILTQGSETAALFGAFHSQPPLHKLAWAVIVLVPLLMLPLAAWLWGRLMQQRQAAGALELRLDGMRARVKDMGKVQADLEGDVQQLTRSDPEDAVAALQRRITESERFVEIQQSRNQMINLEARVDAIRTQQQSLKERIAPTLDTRRSIERMFAELDSRHGDIERALAEVATGDDGTALDVRLKNLTEFARQGLARCDQIEHASKTITGLKESSTELVGRLAPFVAAESGITSRVRELSAQRDEIATAIEASSSGDGTALDVLLKNLTEFARQGITRCDQIEHASKTITGLKETSTELVGRLAPFAAAEGGITSRVRELSAQRDEIAAAVEASSSGDGTALDVLLKNLTEFARQSVTRCDQIEHASKTIATLKEACEELVGRLTPFVAAENGIASRVRELTRQRDEIAAATDALERTPDGALADRVQKLTEDKRRLEGSIAHLHEQFFKLGNLRKDVAGLFSAVDRALGPVSTAKNGNDAIDIDGRIDDLSRFVEQTQNQFDGVEGHVLVLSQVKGKLGELQSRLVPLESSETGVATLIEELETIREKLIAKVRNIEGGEEGDLAARVRTFADAKGELEERVSALADQFTKLSSLRKDIAGLFDKLSSAVSASSN